MARSVAHRAVQSEASPAVETLSDATAGGIEYDSLTLQPCVDCVDQWLCVAEQEIAEALVGLLEQHSKLVEGEEGRMCVRMRWGEVQTHIPEQS